MGLLISFRMIWPTLENVRLESFVEGAEGGMGCDHHLWATTACGMVTYLMCVGLHLAHTCQSHSCSTIRCSAALPEAVAMHPSHAPPR